MPLSREVQRRIKGAILKFLAIVVLIGGVYLVDRLALKKLESDIEAHTIDLITIIDIENELQKDMAVLEIYSNQFDEVKESINETIALLLRVQSYINDSIRKVKVFNCIVDFSLYLEMKHIILLIILMHILFV